MKKSLLLAVLLPTALTAMLTACGTGSTAQTAAKETTASPAQSTAAPVTGEQTTDTLSQNIITVNASATVSLVPDRAEFSVGVTTEAESADEAQQKNTADVNSVIDMLKNAGVEEKSIRTTNYDLSPRYDYSDNTQKIVGYTAVTTLTVDDRPVDTVGDLISQCVSAGANDIQNIRYYCSGYDEAYAEALKQAVESAHTKAQALADAAGRTLGDAVVINEQYQDTSPRYTAQNFSAKATSAADESMTVMPGETDIEAQISVTYALK